jgi:hypothetical protein
LAIWWLVMDIVAYNRSDTVADVEYCGGHSGVQLADTVACGVHHYFFGFFRHLCSPF